MFGQTWYNKSISNYIHLFGALFNDLSIQRLTYSGGIAIPGQLIKVPIEFGPKEKWLVRELQDPHAGETTDDGTPMQRPVEIVLPRMSFEMSNPRYDPTRKLDTISRTVTLTNNNGQLSAMYNPVPYIFPFNLYIGTKMFEDMCQIIEQILPYFTTSFPVTIIEGSQNQSKVINVNYTGINIENLPYGAFDGSPIKMATLTFDLYGYLYLPANNTPIIRQVDIELFALNHPISDNEDTINLPLYYESTELGTVAGDAVEVTPVPPTVNAADTNYTLQAVVVEIDPASLPGPVGPLTYTTRTMLGQGCIREATNKIQSGQSRIFNTFAFISKVQVGRGDIQKNTPKTMDGQSAII